MAALLIDDETELAGPAMSEQRAYLAVLLNALSAPRMTEALRRVIGPQYFASTCAGVYAIVRKGTEGPRESARGRSWSDALDTAKHKWGWDLQELMKKREGNHGQQ